MQQDLVDNRYSVLGTLGGGGMGQVYLARDELLDREVALKVLRAQHAENKEFVERFRREAKNAAALSHPNIVSVYDAGESPDGTPYMAMEHIGGGTLGELIEREAPLDSLEAAGISLQVAQALQEAHRNGVIHRDIKPLNIFLDAAAVSPGSSGDSEPSSAAPGGILPGSIKVGDFGIARAAAETAMTETSLILGTVRYLSPEQAMGEEVGPASDLYSLGIVLYEMLTGEVPFDAENPIAIAMKHVSEAPEPPREKNPSVPEGLQAITLKLLAKEPEDRYANTDDLIEDLERVTGGQPPAHAAGDETQALNQTSRLRRETGGAKRGFARPGRVLRLAGAFVVLTAALILAVATSGFADLYDNLSPQSSPQPVAGMKVPEPSAIAAPLIEVEVPKATGKTQEEAERLLNAAGFEVAVEEEENSERDAGTVLSQSPEEGAEVERGSRGTITVARAPATGVVPDLAGMSPEEAERALSENGLKLGAQGRASSSSVPAGLIMEQDVRARAEVSRGTVVGVTVSSGPAPEPAPVPAPQSTPAPAPEPTPAPEPSGNSGSGDVVQSPNDTSPPSGNQSQGTPAPSPPTPSAPAPQSSGNGSGGVVEPIDPPMPDMPIFDD
jgi:hypothetical protein